jgi:hypothetical protein
MKMGSNLSTMKMNVNGLKAPVKTKDSQIRLALQTSLYTVLISGILKTQGHGRVTVKGHKNICQGYSGEKYAAAAVMKFCRRL